ncbi:hypothetical protein BZA05DRAFT_399125 [Tricharina praecox]|uniref:uncharacterized protein n=1 Tax=Tricharina praecox TaxID=43433 RepID=UPI0022202EF2|nr:uncharacterized protein BZA05DRAFT_399125 [Tricharina praecox]KAI5850897.1 hypothetical protein BZA05DRAFT_399125 [Tricharina praecox]
MHACNPSPSPSPITAVHCPSSSSSVKKKRGRKKTVGYVGYVGDGGGRRDDHAALQPNTAVPYSTLPYSAVLWSTEGGCNCATATAESVLAGSMCEFAAERPGGGSSRVVAGFRASPSRPVGSSSSTVVCLASERARHSAWNRRRRRGVWTLETHRVLLGRQVGVERTHTHSWRNTHGDVEKHAWRNIQVSHRARARAPGPGEWEKEKGEGVRDDGCWLVDEVLVRWNGQNSRQNIGYLGTWV